MQLGPSEATNQQSAKESEVSVGNELAKPSPFDLFSSDPASAPAEPAALKNDTKPAADTAVGKPVGRHGRSAAETIIAGASAVSQGSNYFPPIDWSSGLHRTPNPTADYMLRQYCVDGLWDNFAAERAQQCARQMERIYGGHRHCGGCAAQQPCQVAGGCSMHGHQQVNRYRQMPGNFNGCANCAAFPGPMPTPSNSDCAQTLAPIGGQPPVSLTAPSQVAPPAGKVASLPGSVR